jgi:hypothetical protein
MYTIFLQALWRFLDLKTREKSRDKVYAFARHTLIHYAEWMAHHEIPYLDKPGILEFPNETWAAQDLRKADVFAMAAAYAPGPLNRVLAEKSRFFLSHSLESLHAFDSASLTRPLALVMTLGMAALGLERNGLHVVDDSRLPDPAQVAAPTVEKPSFAFSLYREWNWIKVQVRSRWPFKKSG